MSEAMRLRSLTWLVEPLLGRNQLGTLNSCHLNITKPLIIEVDRSCRYLAGSELRSLLSVTDLTAPKTNAGLMNVLHGGRRDHGSNVTFAVLRGIFLGPIFFQSPQVNSYCIAKAYHGRTICSIPPCGCERCCIYISRCLIEIGDGIGADRPDLLIECSLWYSILVRLFRTAFCS